MIREKEFFVKADAILTSHGLNSSKSLHIKNGIVEGLPDNHLIPEHAIVMDFPGHVITPCFCDYHLHFFSNSLKELKSIAGILRSSGITTVFEGGHKDAAALKTKEQLHDLLNIKASGCAIYKKGSYGQYIGKGVKSVQEAKVLIDLLKGKGTDYVKIVNSGIFQPETGQITPGGFEAGELEEIVHHARNNDLKTACHANGDRAVREAVEAGVSDIIHGLHVSEDTLYMMADQGTSLIPTVHAFESLKAIAPGREAALYTNQAVDSQLNTISKAADLEVRVLPGSDSGPPFIRYGEAFIEELKLFRKAGLSTETIVQSAAGEFFTPGMKADFIVMEELETYKVFLDGICLKEKGLKLP